MPALKKKPADVKSNRIVIRVTDTDKRIIRDHFNRIRRANKRTTTNDMPSVSDLIRQTLIRECRGQ